MNELEVAGDVRESTGMWGVREEVEVGTKKEGGRRVK